MPGRMESVQGEGVLQEHVLAQLEGREVLTEAAAVLGQPVALGC